MSSQALVLIRTDNRCMPTSVIPQISVTCRWTALSRKPFKQQVKAPEFLVLGLFFSLNVLVLQFYLGTARIQLEELSANYKVYVQALSVIVPGAYPVCEHVVYFRCTTKPVGYESYWACQMHVDCVATGCSSVPACAHTCGSVTCDEQLFVAEMYPFCRSFQSRIHVCGGHMQRTEAVCVQGYLSLRLSMAVFSTSWDMVLYL
jgi:hypothetical protein